MRVISLVIPLILSSFSLQALASSTILDSTNLPLVIIHTNGVVIADEPKVTVDLKIIFRVNGAFNRPTDPGNIYDGKAGIEYRGAYSQLLPQKPYGFETRDAQGNNLNVPLLGMPAENDWILLANYNDKVFMRNMLAFDLFRAMGHYAPRTRLCEVVVNGEYMGIFVLTEKIKRDKNRVDIARLDADDNAGDSLSGGYMFAIDYYDDYNSWPSNYVPIDRPGQQVHFVYKYPEPEVITPQQKNYLKSYVNVLESKLYGHSFTDPAGGYRAYLDVHSFIDYFIVGEVSRNVDAYKKSCFYYKDRDDNGGLVHAGPVWDFDWAWKNLLDNCYIWEATDGSNWAYRVNECNNWPVVPSWMKRMLQDPVFRQDLETRYVSLRSTLLSEDYLNHYIDSIAALVDTPQKRHYDRWPILGEWVGAPEVDPPAETFAGEIEKFRNWIALRLHWIDANMPPSEATGLEAIPYGSPLIRLFPNPVEDFLQIESDHAMRQIELFNSQGSLIMTFVVQDPNRVIADLTLQSPGLYIARITLENQQVIACKFVIDE
jgi:hypothetical protein